MTSKAKVCDLCCHEATAWGVGVCDHPVCLSCCVRMRVLCNQRECPVCREDQNQVVVVDKVKPFLSISTHRLQADRKYGLLFEKAELNDRYKALRDNRCSVCCEVFRTMASLRDHTRKAHDRHYCEICLENLKLFPFEFKTYTRQELTRHRRDGDPDDKSHKGHPLCKFCDARYLDNDALHMHLRTNHFWCHLCESDGKQEFYGTYPSLRQHFKKDHFLCEEGSCRNEQYTAVFRSKIDIQAHRAQVHTRGLSKAEARQLRQIDVGFTYGKSEGDKEEAGYNYVQARGRQGGPRSRAAQKREREELELATALSVSVQQSKEKQGNSPKSEQRGRKSPHLLQPPGANPVVDRKEAPPVVTNQAQEEPVSYYRELSRSQNVKKPPGFESAVNTGGGLPEVSEWPDLSGNNPQTATNSAPPPPPRYAYATSGVHAPPGFPQTSQVPPRQQVVQYRPPGLATAVPGRILNSDLRNEFPQLSNGFKPQPLSPALPPGITVGANRTEEAEVMEMIRAILNHNGPKFTEFMTLSGWYRHNEITTLEYASQCYDLMGEAWNEVGPQLALVIPDMAKQKELTNFFRSKLRIRPQKKTSREKRKQPSAWHGGKALNKGMQLSEEDYPSLGSGPRPTHPPPGLSDPWNFKVSV